MVAVRDGKRPLEVEECNSRERLTSFESDLVTCAPNYTYDIVLYCFE